MSIFKAYDVRGIYPSELNEELAKKIGFAFTKLIGAREVVVGCDARLSGPSLKKAFEEGVLDAGAVVLDIGLASTPLAHFAVAHYKRDGGAEITASHNPPGYNGVKFFGKNGVHLSYDTGIKEIEKAVSKKTFSITLPKLFRKTITQEVTQDYLKWVVEKNCLRKKIRVVIDCGNGACGPLASQAFKQAGCDVIELFCETDGNFPNHLPDPTREENLTELRKKLVEEKADVGMAFDGDGDRVVFVDDENKIVPGDVALAVFARDILEKNPGAKIVFEVKCSRALPEVIKAAGGTPVWSKVGHSFAQATLRNSGALLAGELSGHYHFAEIYGADDAVFAGLRMAEIISRKGMLSKLTKNFPRYHTTRELRVPFPEERKYAVVKKIGETLEKSFSVINIDGVRVELEDAWGLLRASNTEPFLSIRFEGRTRRALEEVYAVFEKELAKERVLLPELSKMMLGNK